MLLLSLNIENKLFCGKTKTTSTSKGCYTGRQTWKLTCIYNLLFLCVCVCVWGGVHVCVCVCFGYACLMQIWSVFLNWFLYSYSVAASFIDSTSGIFIPEGTKLTKMTYGISYFTWLIFQYTTDNNNLELWNNRKVLKTYNDNTRIILTSQKSLPIVKSL